MYVENISISLEQLGYKPFKGLIIDSGIWIKKIEINIDQTLLGGLTWENERKCYAHVTYDIRGRIVTVFVRVLLAFRHWIRFVFTQARSKIKYRNPDRAANQIEKWFKNIDRRMCGLRPQNPKTLAISFYNLCFSSLRFEYGLYSKF